MNRNNLVVILTGNCFILAFNMLYDFLVLEKKEYHSFILWNMIFYLILFVGNLYIFLQVNGNILDLFIGTIFGWILAKLYQNLIKEEKFFLLNIMNIIFMFLTIWFAYIFL